MTTTTLDTAVPAVPQHMLALAKGNDVRIRRARILCDVENGDMTMTAALAMPCIQGCTILQVLERVRMTGSGGRRTRREMTPGAARGPRRQTVHAINVLEGCGIDSTTKVRDLSAIELAAILDCVPRCAVLA